MDWFIPIAASLGAGFAIDVAIVTISRFRDESLSFTNWTAPVSGFHIVFLTLSYFISWSTVQNFPLLAPVVGLAGFILMAIVIYEVLCKATGIKARFSLSEHLERWLRIPAESGNRILAGIAISLDTLMGGPAVAIVAHKADWSLSEVLLSFVIVGVTVGLIAEGALLVAKWLRQWEFHSIPKLCLWLIAGTYLEVSVLGGFGTLSLWEGVSKTGDLFSSFLFSSVVSALIFTRYWRRLLRANYEHAKSSIER